MNLLYLVSQTSRTKMRVLAVVMAVLLVSPLAANYCVNCDTFLSCLLLCRDGVNKLERADRERSVQYRVVDKKGELEQTHKHNSQFLLSCGHSIHLSKN